MQRVKPIQCAHLLPELDQLLVECLRKLSPADWNRRTVASEWSIKDVAAHLLDTNIRAVSMLRDEYHGEAFGSPASYDDLLAYLNRLNADWVRIFRRVSPDVLTDLLEITGKPYCDRMQSLDPSETARISVAWAGETQSQNWFHVAREYTEKWHHQQQIRLAVGESDILLSEHLYLPYLDTSMRALPYHYRGMSADEGTVIRFCIRGMNRAQWYLMRTNDSWELLAECAEPVACMVEIDAPVAWKIFTKGIQRQEAQSRIHVEGEQRLGVHVLDMIAVMA